MSVMTPEQCIALQDQLAKHWPDPDYPNHHPSLHLLAIERTGWRRWLFGRWVYNSEPFRRDIQRQMAKSVPAMNLKPWERIYDPRDKSEW